MERHPRQVHRAQERVREAPGADPAVALLIAVLVVILALAIGTGLYLLVPAF